MQAREHYAIFAVLHFEIVTTANREEGIIE